MASLIGTPKHISESLAGEIPWLKEAHYEADHTTDGDVVVDLATVEGMRSDDLNELIQLNLRIKHKGRKLVLKNVQDQVWQVFMVTRMDRLFEIRKPIPS